MTSERDVRDRLAEALWWQHTQGRGSSTWAQVGRVVQELVWLPDADTLLRAISRPSVGLTISTDPQDDGGRG